MTKLWRRMGAWVAGLLVTAAGGAAWAEPRAGYAEPPDGRAYVVVGDGRDTPPDPPRQWGARSDSVLRLSVGSAGRTDFSELRPGLFAAADFGKGPAGFRASAAWVRVGYDDPLSQYTGELTLALLETARFVPTVGAGAGLARTYRVDPVTGARGGSANLGVGVLRAQLDYRLPLGDTDARTGIAAIGTMPAIRANDAPELRPWLLLTATVTVGF